jgi:3-oxoadipate enol-lactonase / 4-carboxymuconolactone decarboxylase
MAWAQLNEIRCYYRLEGVEGRPVLALAHSLGLDHAMWNPQLPDVLSHFRVLRYDLRGHGATDAPAGDYTIEQLGRDALALLDRLGLERVQWCGLSLGGMVGQWLAIQAPERLSRLVLANTSARLTDPAAMEARRLTVLAEGMGAVADAVMGRFFTRASLEAHSPFVGATRATLLATDPVGYAGGCAAARDHDQVPLLRGVRTPTLVISGDADVSMPWEEHGAVLAREVPHAQVVRLPTAHLSNLGLPRAFTRAVLDFLVARPADLYEAGLEVRREALGRAHVDRAMASTTHLTRAFQELVTRFPWGAIWTRPGLDHRTRRLLVLVTTASLGRWEEFRLHLAAGLERELEWTDVEEALLQTAVYAGVPAANTAFHIAVEEQTRRPDGPPSNA